MQSDLIQGLILLAIGMTTVFVILTIIVVLSRWLIILLNRSASPVKTRASKKTVYHKDVVIISAVVHHLTKGQGEVINISKPIMKNS